MSFSVVIMNIYLNTLSTYLLHTIPLPFFTLCLYIITPVYIQPRYYLPVTDQYTHALCFTKCYCSMVLFHSQSIPCYTHPCHHMGQGEAVEPEITVRPPHFVPLCVKACLVLDPSLWAGISQHFGCCKGLFLSPWPTHTYSICSVKLYKHTPRRT